jgi:hypothetical protein
MTTKLFLEAIKKYLLGFVFIGLLIFYLQALFYFITVGCLWEFYLYQCSLQEL